MRILICERKSDYQLPLTALIIQRAKPSSGGTLPKPAEHRCWNRRNSRYIHTMIKMTQGWYRNRYDGLNGWDTKTRSQAELTDYVCKINYRLEFILWKRFKRYYIELNEKNSSLFFGEVLSKRAARILVYTEKNRHLAALSQCRTFPSLLHFAKQNTYKRRCINRTRMEILCTNLFTITRHLFWSRIPFWSNWISGQNVRFAWLNSVLSRNIQLKRFRTIEILEG